MSRALMALLIATLEHVAAVEDPECLESAERDEIKRQQAK